LLRFLGSKFVYPFRCMFAHILNWYWYNQALVYNLYPNYILHLSRSLCKHSMAQSISCSCDTMTMRQAEWDISDLITKSL
jgi:hypothetical protein